MAAYKAGRWDDKPSTAVKPDAANVLLLYKAFDYIFGTPIRCLAYVLDLPNLMVQYQPNRVRVSFAHMLSSCLYMLGLLNPKRPLSLADLNGTSQPCTAG